MNKETHNTLVPALRFPEFQDEEGWEEKTISEIGKIITGNTPNTKERSYYGGERLFVSPSDIGEHRYINQTLTTLTEIGYSSTRHIKANSILFVCIGSTIGKIAQNKIECATNQQINSIIPFDSISNNFLYSILENIAPRIAEMAGNHAVPIINKSAFSSILICVPSLPEQQKIADCLSSLDELIQTESQILEALKTHKKGLMQQLFPAESQTVPQLRFPEFMDDEEWEEKSLGEVANIVTGNTPSTNELSYYGEEKLFVSPADISEQRYITQTKTKLTEIGFAQTRKVKANSVLFVCIGSTIGKVAQNKIECATNQQINSLIPKDDSSGDFLYSILEYKASTFASLAGKQAVPIINKTVFSSVELYFPKIAEQQKIADCLSSLDEQIATKSQQIEALKIHKKGLMQQLFPTIDDRNT
ncbi:MAG: restriction endonuclease subunit S [Flectobacillus sp.]|uniref:restriction endonuclease subunit S n=1 Tax=Flectobacillus sp. TaxID=50419 RepID=UPI003B991FC3